MPFKTSYIGTNFGHSSSSCLVDYEGQVIFAVEEDKIIKEKHTAKFPAEGLKLISETCHLEDSISLNEGWQPYKRLMSKGVWHTLKYWNDPQYYRLRFKKEFKRFREGQRLYANYGRFNYCGHHLAHAYSLLPYGLPKKSLIFVSDTIGESESMSFFYWDGSLELIKSIAYPHSPGSVFHQFAYHLGFKGRTAPGKLMALSGFGRPIWVDELQQFAHVSNGTFCVDLHRYPAHRLKDAPNQYCRIGPSTGLKKAMADCENKYTAGKDVAASIQQWFEVNSWNTLRQQLDHVRHKLKLEVAHIGLTGGAALNCQANGWFLTKLKELNIDSIVVSPWSDDSGTSIGAAISSFVANNPGTEVPRANAFLGPEAMSREKNDADNNHSIALAVNAILSGKLIALVSGKTEFGPRALGGRCILASAFDQAIPAQLNNCKSRPDFMPFAPAVLEEDYCQLFEGNGSDNMAWTVKVREQVKAYIPGAVHITGEARVQIVKPENKLLYELLTKIRQFKGVGIVLLTSLNGTGETIPIYQADALAISQRLRLYGMLSDAGWEALIPQPNDVLSVHNNQ